MELATQPLECEEAPFAPVPDHGQAHGLLARFGYALMRRLRGAAWKALDLHTEFDVLDD